MNGEVEKVWSSFKEPLIINNLEKIINIMISRYVIGNFKSISRELLGN
jgi:hypothetical protein